MGNYSEKLRSPMWQKKRLEILSRDNFTCQLCGDTETELHVHHLKYTGEPYEALNEDLQTLCKHCHLITEVLNSKKNFDGKLTVLKTKDFLCMFLSKGTMIFPITNGELEPNQSLFFDINSDILKSIYEINKSYRE